MQDEGAKTVAAALENNDLLTEIELGSNGITDEGCISLASTLLFNTTLQSLGLRFNRIGDDGAEKLATMLLSNTTLERLALQRNDITDKGGKALIKVRGVRRSIPPQIGVNSIPFGSPHVRPMGVHRTCGEPNETRKNAHPKNIPTFFLRDQALEKNTHLVELKIDGTRREPFNSTPMAANSISSGSPHVRCTPMGRTCGEPDEIKKNTHPKNFTALFREQATT